MAASLRTYATPVLRVDVPRTFRSRSPLTQPLTGATTALWGCAGLVVLVTAGALCVPDVRNLRRRTTSVAQGGVGHASADTERPVGGLG
ncbi:hypothetical protein GCM10011428_18350 [Streptomyces violaceus]